MILVVLTAAGAAIALRAYNATKVADPDTLTRVLASIRQQAGVMAAICSAVFAIIAALQGRSPVTPTTSPSPSQPIFGTRSSTGGPPGPQVI